MTKLLTIFISILMTGSMFSQVTSFEFLKFNYNARAAAMGDLVLTSTGSPGLALHNPASLYNTQNKTIHAGYSNYVLDIYGTQASYAQPKKFNFMKSDGFLSIQVIDINYGEVNEVDKFGYTTGRRASANDFALVAGWSALITHNFIYGVNMKLAWSSLDSYSSTGIFSDFGLIYTLPHLHEVKVALVLANMGFFTSTYTSVSQKTPFDLRMGISKELAHLPLIFHFSLHGLNHKGTQYVGVADRWNAGLEFKFHPMVTLRFGLNRAVQKSLKLENSGGFTGTTLGFGIRYQKAQFDFAYKNYGDAGSPVLIGFNYLF